MYDVLINTFLLAYLFFSMLHPNWIYGSFFKRRRLEYSRYPICLIRSSPDGAIWRLAIGRLFSIAAARVQCMHAIICLIE